MELCICCYKEEQNDDIDLCNNCFDGCPFLNQCYDDY